MIMLARFMLDYLQAFALLGLIITHYFLVRGCFSIKAELPIQGGIITGRLDRTADLLDEMAQLIADFSDNTAVAPPAAKDGSPIGVILNALMSRSQMGSEYATPQQPDWEIFPPNENTPTTEEYQPNDGGPAVPNR